MIPGRIDSVVVRRHLFAMYSALQTLARHNNVTISELKENRDRLWAIERGLQLVAQNALDIATHVAAAEGFDSSDYATAIDRLGALGVLSPEFTSRFRGIAGFRNVLVHGYLELDLSILHTLLTTRLQDFTVFTQSIEQYLARTKC